MGDWTIYSGVSCSLFEMMRKSSRASYKVIEGWHISQCSYNGKTTSSTVNETCTVYTYTYFTQSTIRLAILLAPSYHILVVCCVVSSPFKCQVISQLPL